MNFAPSTNWALYESMAREHDEAWLRKQSPQDKYRIYCELFDTVFTARRQLTREAVEDLSALTAPSPELFRCAGTRDETDESARRQLKDWTTLESWRWEEKIATRRRIAHALQKLDTLRNGQATSFDAS